MFVPKSYTLKELASLLSTDYSGNGEIEVSGVSNLEEATKTEVTFLANDRYHLCR